MINYLETEFYIKRYKGDGSLNRRFFKVLYTSALRLGVPMEIEAARIDVKFQGSITDRIQAHGQNLAYIGELTLNQQVFDDVIVIVRPWQAQRYELISFWPQIQHPDAYKSYTDPLVDTAMFGTPISPTTVATEMHAKFCENPGVSPAVLMQRIYENQLDELSQAQIDKFSSISNELSEALTEREQLAEQLKDKEVVIELQQISNQKLCEEIEQKIQIISALENENESLKLAVGESNPLSQEKAAAMKYLVGRNARLVTKVWQSLTGSNYKNAGVLGMVIDVQRVGDCISLRTIDTKGNEVQLTDFGYQGFVKEVFDYLYIRKGSAAVFLLTWKPNSSPRLATDTMMLPRYRPIWEAPV